MSSSPEFSSPSLASPTNIQVLGLSSPYVAVDTEQQQHHFGSSSKPTLTLLSHSNSHDSLVPGSLPESPKCFSSHSSRGSVDNNSNSSGHVCEAAAEAVATVPAAAVFHVNTLTTTSIGDGVVDDSHSPPMAADYQLPAALKQQPLLRSQEDTSESEGTSQSTSLTHPASATGNQTTQPHMRNTVVHVTRTAPPPPPSGNKPHSEFPRRFSLSADVPSPTTLVSPFEFSATNGSSSPASAGSPNGSARHRGHGFLSALASSTHQHPRRGSSERMGNSGSSLIAGVETFGIDDAEMPPGVRSGILSLTSAGALENSLGEDPDLEDKNDDEEDPIILCTAASPPNAIASRADPARPSALIIGSPTEEIVVGGCDEDTGLSPPLSTQHAHQDQHNLAEDESAFLMPTFDAEPDNTAMMSSSSLALSGAGNSGFGFAASSSAKGGNAGSHDPLPFGQSKKVRRHPTRFGASSSGHGMSIRETISEIIPGKLYLGGVRAASNQLAVHDNRITSFLDVAVDVPVPQHILDQAGGVTTILNEEEREEIAKVGGSCGGSGGFEYLHLPLKDKSETVLADHFSSTFSFIRKSNALGRRVLVFCREGKSRSASIAIAFCMEEKGMCYEDALAHVRSCRETVDPNLSFCTQLSSMGGNSLQHDSNNTSRDEHSSSSGFATVTPIVYPSVITSSVVPPAGGSGGGGSSLVANHRQQLPPAALPPPSHSRGNGLPPLSAEGSPAKSTNTNPLHSENISPPHPLRPTGRPTLNSQHMMSRHHQQQPVMLIPVPDHGSIDMSDIASPSLLFSPTTLKEALPSTGKKEGGLQVDTPRASSAKTARGSGGGGGTSKALRFDDDAAPSPHSFNSSSSPAKWLQKTAGQQQPSASVPPPKSLSPQLFAPSPLSFLHTESSSFNGGSSGPASTNVANSSPNRQDGSGGLLTTGGGTGSNVTSLNGSFRGVPANFQQQRQVVVTPSSSQSGGSSCNNSRAASSVGKLPSIK